MADILTITANPLLDWQASGELIAGKVNRVAAFIPVAGGKGINVGRVLARHGHRVVAAGFAGGASGASIADLVAADGMEPLFVSTAARSRIGFQIAGGKGAATAVLEDGFAVTPSEIGIFLNELRRVLPDKDLVIVSGSVPDASCRTLYRMILDCCAVAGVICWVDAYGEAMQEALAGPHPPALVKPNRQEYERSRAWVTCPELHLTDGGDEVRVRHPTQRLRVTPPNVAEINPIGSGDCYLAALAHARLDGMPLEAQVRYAAAAGAANAARADVARIGPEDIQPLVDQVQVDHASE